MRPFLAAIGTAALAAWSFATPCLAQAKDDMLVVGAAVFTDSISPAAGGYITLSLVFQTWEPLVARDADDKLVPALAERWETLSPTHWRFHLRRGVKWHDGTPFTAADVKFTIDYVTDPKTVYVRKGRIAGIVATEVVDENTVDIRTAAPAPLLLRGLADIAVEQKAVTEKLGQREAHRRPVGTGPWKFGEWVAGDRYDLVANPDYWGGPPAMKRLRIRTISEGATRVASLIAGETHIIEEVPVDLLPSVERRRNLKVDSIESSVSLVLTFDTRKPPFNDVRVRQAVDYAIDKKTLLQQMLGGYGSVLDGQLVTKATFGHNPNLQARPFDLAKAKALLAEAGHPKGFDTKITTLSGRYLSDVDIANAAAGMMTAAGVRATVNVVEGGVWSQLDRNKEQGPMYQIGWFSVGDADFNTVWYTEASKRNYWTNAEFDRLWEQGRSTLDEAERLRIYHRMMAIMHEELPSIFLFGLPRISARLANVEGWQPSRDSLLRLHKVKVK
ncbi:peptide/nickel transport system substrate-binding protein [Stella humosa]|uniref:Peptide/nickel transport system substrate-binding protein n=1 Tax=Stella humosa TaxID=94 RepID=A0A3N1LIU9_9PROT|nr:ABC transporter substrate-binding protein [Stella humosa]ROP91074.1 peptide/nickel transport system substrate-binding protein [Stella humosa]BBK34576.1 ABC transporter substrate-binding protein [Stella humosa]